MNTSTYAHTKNIKVINESLDISTSFIVARTVTSELVCLDYALLL